MFGKSWEQKRDNEQLFKSCYLTSEFCCHHKALSPWLHQIWVFIPKRWQSCPEKDSQPGNEGGKALFACLFVCLSSRGKLVLTSLSMHVSTPCFHSYVYSCLQFSCFYLIHRSFSFHHTHTTDKNNSWENILIILNRNVGFQVTANKEAVQAQEGQLEAA